jgi:transcriptional regulator with XRE-family HTH domain
VTDPDPDASAFLARLGQRVSARREALGISQRELARRAGLHPSYVATIETGRRNVSAFNLARLARALDYEDVGQLMDGLSLPS